MNPKRLSKEGQVHVVSEDVKYQQALESSRATGSQAVNAAVAMATISALFAAAAIELDTPLMLLCSAALALLMHPLFRRWKRIDDGALGIARELEDPTKGETSTLLAAKLSATSQHDGLVMSKGPIVVAVVLAVAG